MEEFTFKKSWLEKAKKTIPAPHIAELIILSVEYGVYGKHEKVGNEVIAPLLEDIKSDIDAQCAKPKKKPKIPPSLDEVVQYVNDNNLNVDPYHFWNFYESKGWYVGKNKMKNWHNSIATWVRNQKNNYAHGNETRRQQEDEFKAKLNSIFAK